MASSKEIQAAVQKNVLDPLLHKIQGRILWLSMQIVHHANNVRPKPDGMKVGGHQPSSSSVVTILTELFFEYMQPSDRIAVKPHASPVFHGIQYLLGNLDRSYLERLRDFHGLQAYPSRTKDPDGVDFSTGSVGLGAIAPNFAALVQQYAQSRRSEDKQSAGRFIALVGDAELNEGSVWEAIVEPLLRETPNILWVVDLNRQSLDRIVPGIQVQMWRQMFSANGWRVVDAKYGSRLEAAFRQPKGELLRECIDGMPNEAYQRLLRLPGEALRKWLPKYSRYPKELSQFIGQRNDDQLKSLVQNLGGHDFATLRRALREAGALETPTVVFAYTLKGWRLPSVGDPQNHQVLLSQEQMDAVQRQMGVPDVWATFDSNTEVGRFCKSRGAYLRSGRQAPVARCTLTVPTELGRPYSSSRMSTQQAFGVILVDIARDFPVLAERLVTASPDVASSTNLGGWINKVGVWSPAATGPVPEDTTPRALRWRESPRGQHIELGISESNLFMLLGQFGLATEMAGYLLVPLGTLYDPFVCRALESFLYSLYQGGRFIVVGTPSGVTLSREGGAHQSFLTPAIGLAMPELVYYEPCFAQELEWILFSSIEHIVRRERSTYLRLTTKPVDQRLLTLPRDFSQRAHLREHVLTGAYRLKDLSGEVGYVPSENVVHIMATGSVIPEALFASQKLREEGVFANVINVTSPGLLFESYRKSAVGSLDASSTGGPVFAHLFSAEERSAPIVTAIDGHPQTLAWIGGALGTKVIPLGVAKFGESGSVADLYQAHQIDAASIASACLLALEG